LDPDSPRKSDVFFVFGKNKLKIWKFREFLTQCRVLPKNPTVDQSNKYEIIASYPKSSYMVSEND
jgi:hypothetical protein